MIQSSYVFFDLFLLFVSYTEDRSKYYMINIGYTSVFNFFIMTFDSDFCCVSVQKLKYCMLFCNIYVFSAKNTHLWLQLSQCSCVYYILSTEHWNDNMW